MKDKVNILIVHGNSSYPLISTVRDLIFCFDKYAENANCFYLNLNRLFDIPEYIFNIDFDIVFFHTIYVSGRWGGKEFFEEHVIRKAEPLKRIRAVKVAHPQDEWIHTRSLVEFMNRLEIDHIFSVSPESEWLKIYEGVDFSRVKFHKVLTGYIDDHVVDKITALKKKKSNRSIDIGYRAFRSPPWLGRHGFLKTKVADVFLEQAPKKGFNVDISTNQKDTIVEDKWYEFMLDCRYFIGVEGGSTIIDPEGEIWKKGTEFMKQHPDASFGEVEAHCFPGMDGNLGLLAISPRHLESCITETCQVLIEGDYNGILKPWKHYIPLKKDFSDLDAVLEKMKDEELRLSIAANAYSEIVGSGRYSYRAYVQFIIDTSLEGVATKKKDEARDSLLLKKNRREEEKRWRRIANPPARNKLYNYYKYSIKPRITGRLKKIFG